MTDDTKHQLSVYKVYTYIQDHTDVNRQTRLKGNWMLIKCWNNHTDVRAYINKSKSGAK